MASIITYYVHSKEIFGVHAERSCVNNADHVVLSIGKPHHIFLIHTSDSEMHVMAENSEDPLANLQLRRHLELPSAPDEGQKQRAKRAMPVSCNDHR